MGQPQRAPGTPSTSAYNVLNVAMTRTDGNGEFTIADKDNIPTTAANGRTFVHMVAPGVDIAMATANTANANAYADNSGTSFAAPHVSGAAALLESRRITRVLENVPRSTTIGVDTLYKAVLMNSADKVKDDGTYAPEGFLLGMQKTISAQAMMDANGAYSNPALNNWFESTAYSDITTPLDYRIGAGALNASRALTQFEGGRYERNEAIPLTAWAQDLVISNEQPHDYYFRDQLFAGSFISATLSWNRVVGLNDELGDTSRYNFGETFTQGLVANLDLYLIQNFNGEWFELGALSSLSAVMNVEHIFSQLPLDGYYGLRVKTLGGVGQVPLNYSLAWWAIPSPGTTFSLLGGAGFIALRRRRS